MGQWTGLGLTPEQHRAATLARIADALDRIANRPRFVRLGDSRVIAVDHIYRITIGTEGWGRLYLSGGSDYDMLSAAEMAHVLNALERTGGDR